MNDFLHAHHELERLSRRLHKGTTFLSIAIVIVVVIGVTLMGLLNWYSESLEPREERAIAKVIEIEEGTSVVTIADRLEEEGFIRSSTAFVWYVESQGSRASLQAGTYEISPSDSVERIVEVLSSGETVTRNVLISPGIRLDEVIGQLAENEFFNRAEVERALSAEIEHPLLASNPDPSRLEGYIFPDTYTINFTDTAASLVDQVLNNFQAKITPEMEAGFEKQGLTTHEAIVLASIVQQEASDFELQRSVAQVFLSRLEQEIPLGSDVTFVYAARILGVEATPELDSPYNTRINGGLPPGPISNFNITALEAVANPTDTDYLYFVAGDDQNVYFATTLAEHEENVANYCQELCSLEILNQ